MNKKESRTKSSRISPERRGRKPAPNCGVWTADEMEIRENWDFAAVPTEEAIEALAHELKREVSRMHQATLPSRSISQVSTQIQDLDLRPSLAPYMTMASDTRTDASELVRPVIQPEKLKPSAAFLLPREPLPVVGKGSAHSEHDFSYPLNTFTSPTMGTGVVVMVDVTEVRKAILMGQGERIMRSLMRACGLPEEMTRLPSRIPHFPWLQSLPEDDLRLGPELLLKTLGYARLLSADVEEERAWTSAGFPEKWGRKKDPTSFIRLEHRRLKALRLHLEGMRGWMRDPARAVPRKH